MMNCLPSGRSMKRRAATQFLTGVIVIISATLTVIQGADDVLIPEKIFAAQNDDFVHIPCFSSSPASWMRFIVPKTHPAKLEDRMTFRHDTGPLNAVIMTIVNVSIKDSATFSCKAGKATGKVELVVYNPTFSKNSAVRILPSNDVKLFWDAPEAPRGAVRFYNIYVTEVADTVGVAKFNVPAQPGAKKQSFTLEDLKPGAIYDIQVAALYVKGIVRESMHVEGPKTAKLRVETPKFNSPPVNVKAEAWRNSSILVTWKKPPNVDARAIDLYKILYKAVSKKKNAPAQELTVPSTDGADRQQAVLEGLKTRTRYTISVHAILNGVPGKKSQSIVFRHDGFAPELSIRAIAIGPETVLVRLDTIGGNVVLKLRVHYSDDSASKWTKVHDCNVGDYCVVSGLQPRSTYFFSAKGRVDRKTRHVVTHIQTPPSALAIPTDLKVEAQTDHSIKTTWKNPGPRKPVGYILMLDIKGLKDSDFRPFKQIVVLDTLTAEVDGLGSQERYRAKVVPFDDTGKGFASESVLFSIAPTGVDGPQTSPQLRLPEFIELPQALIQVDAYENVSLVCTAIGQPPPKVHWTRNGSVVSQPQEIRNVLHLYHLVESATYTCHAENGYGQMTFDTRVDVSHGLGDNQPQKPILAEPLPERVVRRRGESLNLRCSFGGHPPPAVSWYQSDRAGPIGGRSKFESVLAIPSVVKSITLRCQGINEYGVAAHLVQLVVQDEDVKEEADKDYSVSLHYLPLPSRKYVIKWAIDKGNLDAIRFFFLTVITQSGSILTRNRLASEHRQIRLADLTPGVRYLIHLKTNTAEGIVDDSTIEFIPTAEDVAEEPVILLKVVEIRDSHARVDFSSLTPIKNYKLRLQNLDVRQLGNTILTRTIAGDATSSISLTRLKSNNRYRVILEGVSDTGSTDIVRASVEFLTPPPGGAGIPVASRSGEDPAAAATTTTTTTTQRPVTATTATTTTTTEVTITTLPTTPMSTGSAKETTSSGPQDDAYLLSLRTVNRTPNQVDIRWSVDRGDLDGIANFLVTIKGDGGHTLLEQTLLSDKRSITIQSLTPSTRYFVSLKSRAANGSLLAQVDTPVNTPSADAVLHTSDPSLDFMANELRSNSARLEWALVNKDRRQVVTGFRLKVLDRDENGVNLLTQKMAADSQSIMLRKLPANRPFHVILESLDRTGQVTLRSSLTFKTAAPGQWGDPVTASRSKSPRRLSEPLTMTTTEAPDVEPVFEMEIRPEIPDGARLNWTMTPARNNPVRKYVIKVHVDDTQGRVLLWQTISISTPFFTVKQLQPDTVYFMVLEAFDKDNVSLGKATSYFKLPPPGHNLEPIRATSSKVKDAAPAKPAITSITALDASRAVVKWNRYPSATSRHAIQVRYHDMEAGNYIVREAYPTAGQITIRGLKAGTRYGFELARMDPVRRQVTLSDKVFFDMPR